MKRNLSIKRTIVTGLVALALGLMSPPQAAAALLALSDTPLYLDLGVDPNILFNLSVEVPMGGAAYNDQAGTPAGCGGRISVGGTVGICYFKTTEYLGYFDPHKCYEYDDDYFEPDGTTSAVHSCSGEWSGNFLNWVSMTAIDEFIWTMTGGNRVVDDDDDETVIRRARKFNNDGWFPVKYLRSSTNVAPSSVTPFGDSQIWIYNTDFGINVSSSSRGNAKGSSPNEGSYEIKVKVCDEDEGLESNCVAYDGGDYYKPEGLIQRNAGTKRFGVTSYTLDNDQARDGGVLRSKMKYVGPTRPIAGGGGTEPNPNKEWGTDGLLIYNPDGAAGGLNSGVINYINKFSDPGYKSYDPIGELYYETLRYIKNLGPTPEYSAGLSTSEYGGFQIITNWDDPIQYSCQQTFIIGINDANPWLDKRLPGTHFTSSPINGYSARANDVGQPSNPDPDINVRTLTNTVGNLEGLTGTSQCVGGGYSDFNNSATNKTISGLGQVMGTCPYAPKENSYYIAGLAYYANTTDLRPDLDGDQTVSTFMIDTQEFSTNPLTGRMNMLWLAGKYGGFIDENGNNEPDLTSEWDADGDGEPDNYVLATEPQKLINGLNKAFADVEARTSSAAAVALNSGSLDANSKLYQARYKSGDWTGQLLAFSIDTLTGAVNTPEVWDAGALLTTRVAGSGWNNNREVITFNGTQGIPFRWASLNSAMQTDLDTNSAGVNDGQGQARSKYLRGDDANEGTGNSYRVRAGKLGDIVNSSPVFVGAPEFNYPDALESQAYAGFASSNSGRTKMVYVGGNDGMLHALDATTGEEKLAYVPNVVFPQLSKLTAANYTHRFYVDGSPTVGDAFWSGAWHTVLVGGLNRGGQGVYALDVTDPANFDEANASSLVLWEYTDADDKNLGYSYSRPAVVRMADGSWAAVFGNGYNNTEADGGATTSTSGNAVLYLVNIQNGNLIKKIDTGQGTAQDPTGSSRPNGLAAVSPVDVDGDRIIDYIYGGDLFGNLWKFDVTSSNKASWGVAYGGNPLYVAKDDSGVEQPITTGPEVGPHPQNTSAGAKNDGGYMLYFGTGKYIESGDNITAGTQTQTFYGVWDPNESSLPSGYDRTKLLEQQILREDTVTVNSVTADVRITSDNAITWAADPVNPGSDDLGWYMDLVNTEGGNTDPGGERQVTTSILRNGRIIFTTLIPSGSSCVFGGDGWLMELDLADGSRLGDPPFDIDGDGVFDLVDDGNGNNVAPGGIKSTGGAPSAPGILDRGDGQEYKYLSGTDQGAIQVISEQGAPGAAGGGTRESWQQLR